MSKVTFYLRQLFPAFCRAAEDQFRALRPQFEPLPAYIRACEINQSLHLAVHSCCSLFHVSKHTQSQNQHVKITEKHQTNEVPG